MATKVFNMEGGLHSAAAYSAFENRAYGSCVASLDSFVVATSSGMNVTVSAGDGLINTGLNFARRIQNDASLTVPIAAASTAYARLDTVVAYIDNTVTPTTAVVDNTNGVLKFKSIAGTAAATPVAPTQAAIQASIGAGNPYMPLYNVRVPVNATNMTGATLTDLRKIFTTIDATQIPNGTITDPKIGTNQVKKRAVDFDSGIWWEELGRATLTGASTTINVTQKKFMKVLLAGTAINSPSQLRLRANNASFNVFISNLALTYTAGEAAAADYFWNGSVANSDPFLVESTIAAGLNLTTFRTEMVRDGIIRYSSAKMTTNQNITSITAWLDGGGSTRAFSSGEIIVIGHN